jgi:hypothetical protein
MATMFDVFVVDQRLKEAIEAAREAELPDTYEKLVEIRKQAVAEFHAVRTIKNAGGSYPTS